MSSRLDETRGWSLSVWVFKRTLRSFALLVGASFLIYATLRTAPGNMVDLILGINGTEEARSALRAEFGLDQGIIMGYGEWAVRALTGDLGRSITFSPGDNVAEVASSAFLVTLALSVLSLIVSVTLAFALAVALGRPRPKHNLLLTPLSYLNAAPSFVVAIVLTSCINALIYMQLEGGGCMGPSWYPIPTYQAISESLAPFSFAMISISLGDGLFIDLFNALRAELRSVSGAQYMNAVRAKGAPVLPHMVKNLIVPTLSIFTARLPLVLSAVVVVEYIFTLDGSGYLLLEAARVRDVPLVVGVSLFFIAAVICMNLILDLVKAAVDPREVTRVG